MLSVKRILFLFIMVLMYQTAFTQLEPVKKFDYSVLKGKKLYIPSYEVEQDFIKKMTKQGMLGEIDKARESAENSNKIFSLAMEESSYDATDYIITRFDRKKLIKEKNKEAILLYYYKDTYGNLTANLMITSPKAQVIACALINGLNLDDKNDIRLMINMLNESLTTASEQEEGTKSKLAARTKYKEGVIDFFNGIEGKIFLVPKSEHDNPKKAKQRTEDLETALKTWSLSKYELTTEEEIQKARLNGESDSFYWRDFPLFTQSPLIINHVNYIISTKNDNVVFMFQGKKRLKPETLKAIERNIVAKAEKYKKQLEKK